MLLTGRGAFIAQGAQGGAPATGYSAVILDDSPRAYWRLGEASGTTMNDEQNTYDGTYVNSPTLGESGALAGDSDTSVYFDGTNTYAYADPGVSGTDFTKFSIEAWIKANTATQDCFISYWDKSTSNTRISLTEDDGDKMAIWDSNNGWLYNDAAESANLSPGTWYHIVATFDMDAGERAYYLDGVLRNTDSAWSGISGLDRLLVGREDSDNNAPLDGWVDEVAFYDYILSSTQVTEHYNAGT